MPGWFVHMEAARLAADRLADGDVPAELGLDPAEARRLGEIAHRWRNYLAVGALGPDLFYLMPDFQRPFGAPLFGLADWLFSVWDRVEELFLDPWEKWMGPVGANNADLAAALTGGLSRQLGQAMDEIAGVLGAAVMTVPTRTVDLFGQLTSGPPQGLAESKFYWSDMLHYRRTYDVPRVLLRRGIEAEQLATTDDERADAQAIQAFALGWASHCATDVVGHAFTNAKSGGPFRLHWQRHHLVENHIDSLSYADRFGAGTHHATLGTSALHFRIAWRERDDGPYAGRGDGPAYDYFAGFPAYPLGGTAVASTQRRQHFSMDPGELPEHLVSTLIDTFREVYPDITPQILETSAPEFSDGGRPNERALQVMWQIAFRYCAQLSSNGLTLGAPAPPRVINEHPFPSPPGNLAPGDPDRGVDLSDDDLSFLDVLLAVVAWVLYIGQIVAWLVTVLPALIIDVATFPAREVLHYTVIAPLHSLHMAARRLLVMSGFVAPETVEIDPGLVELGRGSTFWRGALADDVADVAGFAPRPRVPDEPSGRRAATDHRTADPAYPRDSSRDSHPLLAQMLDAVGAPPPPLLPDGKQAYSEWVFPWRYPERDVEGHRIGWEADLAAAGPFLQGDDATILLTSRPTDVEVAAEYEACPRPSETDEVSAHRLPQDRHLGHPVDYTLYLVSRLARGDTVPSFNLDSDRAYAWQCWDWSRHTSEAGANSRPKRWQARPDGSTAAQGAPFGDGEFDMMQPCTTPAQFRPEWLLLDPDPAAQPGDHEYVPRDLRQARYLEPTSSPAGCDDDTVRPQVWPGRIDEAGIVPEGEG